MAEDRRGIVTNYKQFATPAKEVVSTPEDDERLRAQAKERDVLRSLRAQRIRHGQSPDERPEWQIGGDLTPRTDVKRAVQPPSAFPTARTPVPSLSGMRRRRGGGLLIRRKSPAATVAPPPVAEESTQITFNIPPNVVTRRGTPENAAHSGISGIWKGESTVEVPTQGDLSPIRPSDSRIESVGGRFDEHAEGKPSLTIGDLVNMFSHHADNMKQQLEQQAAQHSTQMASPEAHGALQEALGSVEDALHVFIGHIGPQGNVLKPRQAPPPPARILRPQAAPPLQGRIIRPQAAPPLPAPGLSRQYGPPAQYRPQTGGPKNYPYGGSRPKPRHGVTSSGYPIR